MLDISDYKAADIIKNAVSKALTELKEDDYKFLKASAIRKLEKFEKIRGFKNE